MRPTFSSVYRALLAKRRLKITLPENICRAADGKTCTICPAIHLNYDEELDIKNEALRQYFHKTNLDGCLQSIVRSPLERHYRTNSKRRVFRKGQTVYLGLNDPGAGLMSGLPILNCPIEPDDHSKIFEICGRTLQNYQNPAIRKHLNYVIIRGNDEHWAVLFSVMTIHAALLREINQLSKELTRSISTVKSVFVFEDKRGAYYQSDAVRSSYAQFRKIWGDATCVQQTDQQTFFYSPLAFSQTNASIVPQLVRKISEQIDPGPEDAVLDFYSGYGLFGLSVADKVRTVFGADQSVESIASAQRNIRRLKITNARYLRASVTPSFIEGSLRKVYDNPIKVILDPPRAGTAKGVIEQFNPQKVKIAAHLICNADLILREMERWKENGYRKITLFPFDMFPATDSLEMLAIIQT